MSHQSSTAPNGWYYSPGLGFTHASHCTTCQVYATHLSLSSHKPLEWAVALEHCERFRAERNQMSLVLTQSKKESEIYRNECQRLAAEIDSLKKSALTVDSNIPDHDSTQNTTISSHRNTRAPKTIAQLQSLMTAAHESGNMRALSKVKALCAEAHATPRELKTPLQQHLLVHWRNPEHDTPGNAADRTNQTCTVKTNPRRDDPVEVWYDYLCTHRTSWPRGVRRDANNRPFLPDLSASRIIARIKPTDVQNSGEANHRFEFMSVLITLLDTQGFYERLLEENNIVVSPIDDFKPYPPSYPIIYDFVARHLADCGITVQRAREELEPWAQQYKLSSS